MVSVLPTELSSINALSRVLKTEAFCERINNKTKSLKMSFPSTSVFLFSHQHYNKTINEMTLFGDLL